MTENFASVEDVDKFVRHLHDNGYIQRKRCYQLNDATPAMAGIHLIEEVTEYVAACIAPEGMKIADKEKPRYALLLEESADVLACWLHLNYMMGLPLSKIVELAAAKLDDIFVPC